MTNGFSIELANTSRMRPTIPLTIGDVMLKLTSMSGSSVSQASNSPRTWRKQSNRMSYCSRFVSLAISKRSRTYCPSSSTNLSCFLPTVHHLIYVLVFYHDYCLLDSRVVVVYLDMAYYFLSYFR